MTTWFLSGFLGCLNHQAIYLFLATWVTESGWASHTLDVELWICRKSLRRRDAMSPLKLRQGLFSKLMSLRLKNKRSKTRWVTTTHILDAGGPSHMTVTMANSDLGGVLTLFNTNPGSASFSNSIQSFQSRSFEFASPIMPKSVALKELG